MNNSAKKPRRVKRIVVNVVFVACVYLPTACLVYLALTKHYTASDGFVHLRFLILLLFLPIVAKYVIHLLLAPWFPLVERRRAKKYSGQCAPSVSVLVAARNEEVGIRATLQSIVNTRYPRLEIIVVNDGSTDRTHDRATGYIAAYRAAHGRAGAAFRYRAVEQGGKARAFNAGLALAHGEIVVTIDADSVMDRRAIRNMVRSFADPRVGSVAGNVVVGNRKKPLGLIQQLEYLYGFYFKRADSMLNAVYIVGGAAASYRRAVIASLGGFDEAMVTEDIELSTRLQDHGYKIRYAPDAIVYTEGPSDLQGLLDQRFRWKYGRLLTFFKYRHLFFSLSRTHNPYLTFIILPIALFAELLLLFEGPLLAVFFLYTFITNDFLPLLFMVSLLSGVVAMQIVSDPITRYHKNLLLVAPGAWVIFYIMDFVEFQALVKSIWHLITKQTFSWQRWSRVGVFAEKKVIVHDRQG